MLQSDFQFSPLLFTILVFLIGCALRYFWSVLVDLNVRLVEVLERMRFESEHLKTEVGILREEHAMYFPSHLSKSGQLKMWRRIMAQARQRNRRS